MMEILLATGYNWSSITAPFEDIAENLIGNPLLIGGIVLLFFVLIVLASRIGFESMMVIMIPVLFLVFIWIPALQIIVGIMIGVLIGIGLLKWIRR